MIDMSPDWKPAPSEVSELMTELGTPNILCLQEAGDLNAYRDAIPYKHILKFGSNQTALLTNYRVINSKTIDMSPEESYSGWTDLDVNGGIIRVYSLYLASNRITVESERLMEEGTFQSKENIRDALDVLRRYVRRSRIRANQVEIVRKSIAESPYPVIVCGDFNDVPLSYTTSQLTKDLQDSFVAKGFGIGATYAGKLPGLRIDYVLADDHFRILSHDILKLDISDHYPVVVEVDIRE
jgi:endonuclease/exonuclease/phosphatase family metal-dependent hydrolase